MQNQLNTPSLLHAWLRAFYSTAVGFLPHLYLHTHALPSRKAGNAIFFRTLYFFSTFASDASCAAFGTSCSASLVGLWSRCTCSVAFFARSVSLLGRYSWGTRLESVFAEEVELRGPEGGCTPVRLASVTAFADAPCAGISSSSSSASESISAPYTSGYLRKQPCMSLRTVSIVFSGCRVG
jgi:hypothetical protein